MSRTFKVSRADLTCFAHFREPVFGLFQEGPSLYGRFLSRLQSHGLSAKDMRLDLVGDGTLADANLSCFLYSYGLSVRARTERVEVWCTDLLRVGHEPLGQVMVGAVDVLSEHLRDRFPDGAFRAFEMWLNLHGLIEGVGAFDLVSKYLATIPDGLGPNMGAGVVFYYGADGANITSSLTLDVSAVVEKGLYMRLWVIWDAAKVSEPLPQMISSHTRNALARVGLSWTGL